MAFFLWGLVALGLAGVLVVSSMVEFLVPAVAAFVVLLLAFVPGMAENYLVQTLVWLALTGGGLLVFRDRLRRLKVGRGPVEDSVAGKTAVVVEAIGPEGGRVRFQGTTWKASSVDPVAEGATVMVLGQDGLVLQVERLEAERVEEEFKALEGRRGREPGEG